MRVGACSQVVIVFASLAAAWPDGRLTTLCLGPLVEPSLLLVRQPYISPGSYVKNFYVFILLW